jgi:hypothetical protein
MISSSTYSTDNWPKVIILGFSPRLIDGVGVSHGINLLAKVLFFAMCATDHLRGPPKDGFHTVMTISLKTKYSRVLFCLGLRFH